MNSGFLIIFLNTLSEPLATLELIMLKEFIKKNVWKHRVLSLSLSVGSPSSVMVSVVTMLNVSSKKMY